MKKTIQHLSAWSPDVAGLFASYDKLEELPRLLAHAVTTLIPTNIAYVGVHEVKRLPRELYAYPKNFQQPRDYTAELFVLDPFYQAYKEGRTGSLGLFEEAPPDFEQSPYFKKFYEEVGIVDEMLHLSLVPGGGVVGVGIARTRKDGAFNKEERELHEAIFPVVEQVSGRLVHLLLEAGQPLAGSDNDVEDALERFGKEMLTPREQEVVHLVLRGHNTQSVAQSLEIAPDTVKLHRKHAYAKLRVSSQGELFHKFLSTLGLRT
ncbi:MAG: helix-turn-helix transcriptional regulator [Myxococcota bacterium]